MSLPVMDDIQAECFRLFVELGVSRNLVKLYKQCTDLDLGVTKWQLKSWSLRFRWVEQARKTVPALVQLHVDDRIEHNRKLITAYRVLQDRFIARMAIDPTDPNLSEMDKARAIDPDFADFEAAVKGERLILGDPTERHEDVLTSRLVVELGESELLEAARMIASKRYGLPTDAEIKKITDRANTTEPETIDQVADPA